MSVTDFLFQGRPPPSINTYGTTTANIPQWLSDYTQGLLAKGNAVAAEPYQAYGNPRIADFSADQAAAFQATRNAQGAFMPTINQGIGAVGQATQMSGAQAAAPTLNQAIGMSPSTAARPVLNTALGMDPTGESRFSTYRALSMTPTADAAPLLGNAAQSSAGAVGEYMNPYQDAVVNRIGDLAARQLRERLMPEVSDTFIRAGQFGSSRMQEATGRALRDVQESALAAQGDLMNKGYQGALAAAQEDLRRRGQLGQTIGSLGLQEQQNIANIGQNLGRLGLQQQQNVGQLGQTIGNLGLQEQQNLGQLGQVQGNLQNVGNQNLISAGQQLGNLARVGQQLGYTDTAALEAVGQQQQNLAQRNLDTAYQDFLRQTNYPREQLGFLSNLVRGQPYSQTTNTVTNAPTSTYQPSGLAQILGGLTLARALGGS